MSRQDRDLNESRRGFLRDMALMGGVAAATGAAAARAAAPTATATAVTRPKGYRETAHVSKYYAKARI